MKGFDSKYIKSEENFFLLWESIYINSSKSTFRSFFSLILDTIGIKNPNGKRLIDFLSVHNFLQLPLPISERIYQLVLNGQNGENITQKECIDLFELLYYGDFTQRADYFFKLCDFDGDKTLNRKDIELFFLHLNNEGNTIDLIANFFKDKNTMTYKEYQLNINSNYDLVFLFFFSLYENKVFDDDTLCFFERNVMNRKKRENDEGNNEYVYDKRREEKKESYENLSSNIPHSCLSVKLFDYLNDNFNFKLGYSYIKNINEMDDIEIEEDTSDLNALYSFEKDIFLSFDMHGISKGEKNKDKKEKAQSSPNVNKYKSFDIKSKNNSNYAISNKIIKPITEIDDIILPDKSKAALIIVNNFLIVSKHRKKNIKDLNKLFAIIPLKSSMIDINSDPLHSISLIIYSPLRSFHFIFPSTIHLKNFTDAYYQINPKSIRNFNSSYTEISQISQGHFGKVFLVKNKTTGETFLEKRIIKKHPFIREILWEIYISSLLSSKKHPNIVTLYDMIDSFETTHFIMEYLPDGTLASLLSKITLQQQTLFLSQIISAISFMHNMGIVHRDIKLENCVYDERSNCVKLIDFGLSRVLFPSQRSCDLCGTVSYTAPEIVEGERYCNKVDIWSFGVIAFAFVFRKLPFKAKGFNRGLIKLEQSVLFRIIAEKDVGYWERDVLRRVISRALIKEPDVRASARELDEMIKRYIGKNVTCYKSNNNIMSM